MRAVRRAQVRRANWEITAVGTVTLTLVGGPTVLIEAEGIRFLTDPTFDPPQSYDAGAVQLTKVTGPSVDPQSLLPVDCVLLSQDQHFDNLDHAGRAFLSQAGRVLTTAAGAGRVGNNSVALETWQSIEISGRKSRNLRVTASPARHGPKGIEPISGDVIGFVVTPEGANRRSIYVSGDTVWYEGVAEVARRFDIGLAILFTGAARPRGAFRMTMDCNDAIEAAHAFADAKVITVHNEGWQHFTEHQDELAHAFQVVGQAHRLYRLIRGVPLPLEL